jgi:hypothetical protein
MKTVPVTECQLIALLQAKGIKPSKAAIRLDAELPEWTRDELKELYDRLSRDALMDPDTDQEWRRELLSTMNKCPCCDRWLGHNKPSADAGESEQPYRRQDSCKFDR